MGQHAPHAILLVEDEPLIAMAEKMVLERAGYTVITAGTGEKAIEIIANGSAVDLVLMDIDLGPGISGTEAATRILAERELPVVFLSSHTEPEVVEQTEGITSYGYIVKNSQDAVLLASIRMAFRLFETRRLVEDTFTHSINGLCVHRLIRDESGMPSDCEYLRVNSAFENYTGLSAMDVIGRTIRDLYPGTAADDVIRLYGEILAGRAHSQQEFFFPPTESWAEVSVFSNRADEFTVVVNNITERKKAEDALRESEDRLQQLFENMNDAFAVHEIMFDENGTAVDYRFVEVNREFAARLGMTPDDIVGHTALELFPQTERAWIDTFGRVAATGTPEQITEYSRELDRYFETRLYRPKMGYCAGIFMDVTARVQGEMATDRRFRTISDTAVYGNSIADLYGNLVYVNRYLAEVHGYEPEELVGRHLSVFHSPRQMESVNRELSVLTETGRFPPVEIWHVRRDGREFPMLMSGVLIRDEKNDPLYLAASAVDMTEIKRTESRVADAFQRLSTIMSAVPVAIVVFDRFARLIEDNAAARRIFRSTGVIEATTLCGEYIRCRHCVGATEGCGDTPHCRDCTINDAIRHVLRGGAGAEEQDREVIQDTGESFWIRFSVVPLTIHDERCALFVAQEVTFRKTAEAEIARQLAEKETLLREVHHRVKNNVAGIEGLLTLQANSASTHDARVALSDAAARVRSLSELYRKLLLSGDFRNVRVKDYLEDLIASVLRVFPESATITVDKEISDFPIEAKKAVTLGIILNELMTNAFKYAFVGQNGGALSVSVGRDGPAVTLAVKDNGVGLPTGFNTGALPGESSGFGLTLVGMLAEQLNGIFTIESGEGTTSVVRFSV